MSSAHEGVYVRGRGLQHTEVKIALVLHGIFLPVMMDPRNLLVEQRQE
jgi:hypothetical protein